MCNQPATPPDRVQEKNGDPVTLGVWYRRPGSVDIWAFGRHDDLVEAELKTGLVQITAVKYLSWKNLGNGGIVRARVLRTAEQMFDIIHDSEVFREYVKDVIKTGKLLTDADTYNNASALERCRAGLRETQEVANDRARTIEKLQTQIAHMRVKIQYDAEPANEIEWLRSVVEKTLADR